MNYTIVSPFDYDGDFRNCSTYTLKTKRKNKFIRGAVYRLRDKICSDNNICNVYERTYRLIAIVRQIGEVDFDGVIMKQLSGEHPKQIFTLSKDQCQLLHIRHEKGLEIFPINTKFERIVQKFPNEEEFDPNDFSTYPHSTTDGTIREIFIRLDDLKYKDNKKKKIFNQKYKKYYSTVKENGNVGDIINIGGIKIKANDFLKSKDFNREIVNYKPNEEISYYLPSIKSNDVVIGLILYNRVLGGFTEDGYIGLEKSLLKNKKFEDLFTITDDKEHA